MQPTITSKLPDVGTTIFTVMSQLAADHDAINLSQGFPSFDPPQELTDRISYHLTNGANQYAPMPGVPALREAVANKTQRLHGRAVDADHEVSVCTGATEGLFSAIQAIVRPGDEVVVFDPAYDSYEPAVTLAGGTTKHLPLIRSDSNPHLHIDWQRLSDSLSERTRLIILNFPHNPTGVILSAAALEQMTVHPGDHLELAFRVILLLGLGLFYGGVEGAALRAFHVFPPERAVAVATLVVLLLAGGSLNGFVLLVMVDVIMFVTLVFEGRRVGRITASD